MNTVFEGTVQSVYGQAYLQLQGDSPDVAGPHRRGQTNGLLGAGVPNLLFLNFGLHTGPVHLAIHVEEAEPALDDAWEEVVEVSFAMPDGERGLQDWDGEIWEPIPLEPGSYRVRYCAKNYRVAEDSGMFEDAAGEPVERYELTFWPAEPAPDAVIKVTRAAARYWHDLARSGQ